ncbi:MAG: alpha/beta hydrolase [Cytophagaceae bacterium]
MNKIYFIPGLATDQRLFIRQQQAGFALEVLTWIQPEQNESIETYAYRMAERIQEKAPILAGVSFGGIMAIEIAKHIKDGRVILISSVKTKTEIPFYFKLARFLGAGKLPTWFYSQAGLWAKLIRPMFGKMNSEEKQLFFSMIKDADPYLVKWSVQKVLNWNNTHTSDKLSHIHGSSDLIFPIQKISDPISISGGGHFMILQKSNEVNEALQKLA